MSALNKEQYNDIAHYSGLNTLLFQPNSMSSNLLGALSALNNSLPAAESDQLMRHQTTLERRLSWAIGELLALQRSSKSWESSQIDPKICIFRDFRQVKQVVSRQSIGRPADKILFNP